jgi:kynurenine formamidase
MRTLTKWICILSFILSSSQTIALGKPAAISDRQFDQWLEDISNWGRWGKADQLGTLNLITSDTRIAAAGLVKEGISVSLSLPLNTEASVNNTLPFEHDLSIVNFGGQSGAVDRYCVSYHGSAHTHVDGLPHVLHRGETLYNGYSRDILKPDGAKKLGIQNMKDGIVSRGVLVDMAWFSGVDYLEPGTAITVADLEAWEAKTGVTLQSGDILVLSTGRWVREQEKGPWSMMEGGAAGFHASVATWLKARDIAAVASDGGAEVIPSGMANRPTPLHELVLVGLGMPLMDNLDLRRASQQAQQLGRWTFLFVASPLNVVGGTGSPANPLALF